MSVTSLAVNRHEDKYCLDLSSAAYLKERLSMILQTDVHSGDGGYLVRSLYFDTINNKDYNQKFDGIEKRKKIRLRTYDIHCDFCKLEMKEKIGADQHKVSLTIDREIAIGLINGNFNVLLNKADEDQIALKFYNEMTLGCYRPVTIIDYKRKAFIHDLYRTRITFDYEIFSSEGNTEFFNDSHRGFIPILTDHEILEVKYDGVLLRYISKVLTPFNLCQQSFSKYCTGRSMWDDYL